MKSAQVLAAKVVIEKSIPDLKSVKVTGDAENPLEVNNRNLVVSFVTPP